MCEYFECHSCKQFIHKKLICFKFKVWCGTTTLEYLTWLELYHGKTGVQHAKKENDYGLGKKNLVINFANVLQGYERNDKLSYRIIYALINSLQV